MSKKKTVAATTFLTTLITLGIFIPIFWINNNASPLGKYIHIQFTCFQTEKPIVGLPVTMGLETHNTDAEGWVIFGSGFASGTYTYTFEWLGVSYSREVTIDCTKKDWYYYEELVNPEVHKTFLIDTPNNGYPPVEGLDVTLVGYGTKKTDAKGYVAWILDYPFGDYTLEWTWNSIPASEPVYWVDFVEGVWSKTNYLKPKSGGGK